MTSVYSYTDEIDELISDEVTVGSGVDVDDVIICDHDGYSRITTPLENFSAKYAQYHGYLSIVVCAFGIVSSLLVIAVLTRRHMVSSTNYMLTALAVCDMVTMVSYVSYAVQYYVRYGVRPSPDRDTLGWARYCLVHANVSVVAHTSSIWIAVALSAYRYSVVRRSTDSRGPVSGCSVDLQTSRLIVVAVCFSSAVMLLPNYLTLTVSEQLEPCSNRTMYVVMSTYELPDATSYDRILGQLNFWVHALIVKLVPCILMLVFGFLLVSTVRRHSLSRKRLQTGRWTDTGNQKYVVVTGNVATRSSTGSDGGSRTTAMLVSVIVLFLVTELPQGILALVCGIHPAYFDALYAPLGDLMDMVALVNNAVNFILYCTMSRQFLMTFWKLFPCRRRASKQAKKPELISMCASVKVVAAGESRSKRNEVHNEVHDC